jgi:hypothetical protein
MGLTPVSLLESQSGFKIVKQLASWRRRTTIIWFQPQKRHKDCWYLQFSSFGRLAVKLGLFFFRLMSSRLMIWECVARLFALVELFLNVFGRAAAACPSQSGRADGVEAAIFRQRAVIKPRGCLMDHEKMVLWMFWFLNYVVPNRRFSCRFYLRVVFTGAPVSPVLSAIVA